MKKNKIRLPKPLRDFKDWTRKIRRLRIIFPFILTNKFSNKKITDAGGPVVSLTTYGARLDTVYLTIESIAAGYKKPGRMVLWIDDKSAYETLPDSILNLKKRGLEISLTNNYGPHTKYFPQVRSNKTENQLPLVTADDDMLYPRYWLKKLFDAHVRLPNLVHAWRVRGIELNESGLSPYDYWRYCNDVSPSFLHFAEGVSGVIYPVELQKILAEEGEKFMDLCPIADDIWLHVQAIRNGFRISQLESTHKNFPCIPGTEKMGRMNFNVHEGGNDIQIKKTYTSEDIKILLKEWREQKLQ